MVKQSYTARSDAALLRCILRHGAHIAPRGTIGDSIQDAYEDLKREGMIDIALPVPPTPIALNGRYKQLLRTTASTYHHFITRATGDGTYMDQVRQLVNRCKEDVARGEIVSVPKAEPVGSPANVELEGCKRTADVVLVSEDEIEVSPQRPAKRFKEGVWCVKAEPVVPGREVDVQKGGVSPVKRRQNGIPVGGQHSSTCSSSGGQAYELDGNVDGRIVNLESKQRVDDAALTTAEFWPKGPCNNEFEARVALKKLQVIEERDRLEFNLRRFRIEQEHKDRRFQLEEEWKDRREKRRQLGRVLSLLE